MKNSSFVNPCILAFKRTIDLAFSIACLLITLPLLMLIALMIRISSRGPVFYCQLRVGKVRQGKIEHFNMIKFRTMVNDAEASTGAVWALSNDTRLTTIGRFLRKTRLDELPQFINVINRS